MPQSWERFRSRLTGHWPKRHSPAKYPDSYLSWWLGQIRCDAVGFAGCEIARRTIGLAKASDLASLDDAGDAAAETVLRLSRLLLVERGSLTFEQLIRWRYPTDREARQTCRERLAPAPVAMGGAALYLISPIDLVPEAILGARP